MAKINIAFCCLVFVTPTRQSVAIVTNAVTATSNLAIMQLLLSLAWLWRCKIKHITVDLTLISKLPVCFFFGIFGEEFVLLDRLPDYHYDTGTYTEHTKL